MPDSAADVITEVLNGGQRDADAILKALENAGFELFEPLQIAPPSWLPTTKNGRFLVRQAAALAGQGMTRPQIAERMGKNKRSVDRYIAAAIHLGVMNPQPARRKAS